MAKQKQTGDEWMGKLRCPPEELVLFCRQFQAMLASGIMVHQALETLSERQEQPQFGRAVETVASKVAGGHKLSASLRLFPKVFDLVFVSLVSVGEETGQLDKCLERLAGWKERDLEMRRRLVAALTYPVLVLAMTLVMTFFLFYWILPGFIGIFESMGADLPLPTRILIALTNMVASPICWFLTIVTGVFIGYLGQSYLRRPMGRTNIALFLMTTPVLGPLITNAGIARFAASVATMLDSGMDLVRSLALGAQASGNPAITQDSKRLLQEIRMGSLTSVALSERPDLYPPNMVRMIATGEEASDLPDMFARSAQFHEEEANHLMEALSVALEPMLLGFVASILGFVLISVFLPLYSHLDKF